MNPDRSFFKFNIHDITGWQSSRINKPLLVLIFCSTIGFGVIMSTYIVDNVKLLVGIIGGIVFVLLTMRWPEFGILSLVAMVSGIISLSWLPLLHLGPVSLHIFDLMLILLLCLVFLRAAVLRDFTIFKSPLLLPLLLFVGAFLFSAIYSVIIKGVGFNNVMRTLRMLMLWIAFIPTLQLVRSNQALRRLLVGMLILTGILLIGVIFPNKLSPFFPVDETALSTGNFTYSGFTRLYFQGDLIFYAMVPVTVASLAMIKKGNQLWRIVLLGFLLFWAYRSGYRQYWITLPILCVMLFGLISTEERMRLLKRITPVLAIGVILLVILMLVQPIRVKRLVFVITDRIGSLLQDPLRREASLQWRLIETRYALIQFSKNPILGIGLANRYRPPMEAESGQDMYSGWTSKFLENGYLWIAVMMGVVGLLPFLWLCGAHVLRVFMNQHRIKNDGLRAFYLGFGLGFLGLAVCNTATPFFVIGGRLIFFPLVMAISEIILRFESEKSISYEAFKPSPRSPSKTIF